MPERFVHVKKPSVAVYQSRSKDLQQLVLKFYRLYKTLSYGLINSIALHDCAKLGTKWSLTTFFITN